MEFATNMRAFGRNLLRLSFYPAFGLSVLALLVMIEPIGWPTLP